MVRPVVLGALAAVLVRAATFQGLFDATVLVNEEKIPFRMELTSSPLRVCFFEDLQPVCSTSARLESETLIAEWDYMNTELRITSTDNGLSGSYINRRTNRRLSLDAKPHAAAVVSKLKPADFDGEWEMHSAADPKLSWRLLLRQKGSELKGTILRVDGDDGTLVGTVDGASFAISHFSGDRPVLLAGTRKSDGTLDLTFQKSALFALRPVDARARKLAAPDDPSTYAKARNPQEPFRFRFPDLTGKIVTNDDFAGKPLIVTITGSWCPNCRDEAPYFAELHRRYHPQGLEIVALCFEAEGDPTFAPLRAFIRKYAIAYRTLLAGEPGKLREAVPQIENLAGFPTSIYIGKDGLVRGVHSGFPSGGSGEELNRVKVEIRRVVEGLIADKPAR